jgi:hypothetical protein
MKETSKNIRKYSGVRALASSLNMVTNPIFKKRGFVENKIITDWYIIVGEMLAGYSSPHKVVFGKDKQTGGVLHIQVTDGGMAMELSYMEPVIIEKISTYFGYKAIVKLKIIQRPKPYVSNAKQLVAKRQLSILEAETLQRQLADMEDGELKTALARLGKSILESGI